MSKAPTDKPRDGLDRVLVLEIARVTEAAAVAAARLVGRGNEKAADKAAVDSMRQRTWPREHRWYGCHWRGRNGRSADAVHRREGRHRERSGSGYRRRSAGRNDDLRQGDAELARRFGHRRTRRPAPRARYVHEQDRYRPGLPGRDRRSRCQRGR